MKKSKTEFSCWFGGALFAYLCISIVLPFVVPSKWFQSKEYQQALASIGTPNAPSAEEFKEINNRSSNQRWIKIQLLALGLGVATYATFVEISSRVKGTTAK